jgi:hypothetical protein
MEGYPHLPITFGPRACEGQRGRKPCYEAPMSEESFFDDLAPFGRFAGVTDMANFHPLPESWVVGAADIVGSTQAIAAGRYKAVNMAGASVISAVLNALGRRIPFVFGGDGAFLAVPGTLADKMRQALADVQVWVKEELDLDLRAATIAMKNLRATGHDVRIAKFAVAPELSYAMFAGGGESWFEAEMKAGRYTVPPSAPGSRPDLTGLSCRWNPLMARNGEIVSIIVAPAGAADEAYGKLLRDVIGLVAEQGRDGHPVPEAGPEFGWMTRGLDFEARATAPPGQRFKRKLTILATMWLAIIAAKLGKKLGRFDPKLYRADTSRNSDFRKFDDGLKLTIDIGPERLKRLESVLETGAQAGICRYGLHRQAEALITCIVPSPFERDHMHFIDGAAGGYAMAAAAMKAKN